MPVPGPGYSITVRVEAPPSASAAGDLAAAVGRAGAVITAFDVVESHTDRIVVDITANTYSDEHVRDITEALEALPGVAVRKVSDRTFLIHLGGKIEVTPRSSSATVTTSPAPTPPAWPGSARRSRRTRTTRAG